MALSNCGSTTCGGRRLPVVYHAPHVQLPIERKQHGRVLWVGGSWGGATTPYIDIITPRLISAGSSSPCATPTFTPLAGIYCSAQTVTIKNSTTNGATIRYTTDGSTPSETAGTVYSSPVNISVNTTLQAIAYAAGHSDSAISSSAYTIDVTIPLSKLTKIMQLGPLLADWNAAEVPLNGLAVNQWETGASFTSGGTTYPTGIGLKDAGASNPGYSEWWLDGCYQTFSGTFYLDDRTGANPDLQVQLIGDGSLLASSSWLSSSGSSYTFSNVNVASVKVLRINLVGDGWGGLPVQYAFSTSAGVIGIPGVYYNDTFTAGTCSNGSGGSVIFTSAANQPGGNGTQPSINTWGDTGLSLTVGGVAMSGVGVSGPAINGQGSVIWSLSSGNSYQLLNFNLAIDDRWNGATDGTLQLWIDNVQVVAAFPLSTTPRTFSYLLNGNSTIEFLWVGGTWGGATTPYIDIINPRLIVAGKSLLCATPTFSPAAGAYGPAQSVTISTTTGGATIMYTTNGTTPSSTVGTVYSSAVSISATSTLQAIAYESGYTTSAVASGVYTINGACATPTFNPAAGAYGPAQSVTISTTTGGATIMYTTNGTTPSSTVGTVYSSAVSISATSTLQAIAYETGYSTSAVASGVYTINGACATPTFSPAAGAYGPAQSVTISTTTGGATIRYTSNGTTPSSTVGTVYSSAVSISATSTLQAIAYETGYSTSAVASGVYTINGACATPTFSPAAGAYGPAQSVTISTTTGGATIRYTSNGTTPSSTVGTVYSSAVSISATSTLQAIAYETGYSNSAVASGVYTINGACATPTFNPAPGTFTTSTSVTISTTTGGASIRYTTNGTTPSSTVGTVYSSVVSITATSTLQAIAYETGYTNSSVASGVYTIQCAAPTFNPAAGSYTTSTAVTISTTTGGATIRYTTNGTTPSSTVGTVYSSALSITATSTLQAIAYESGLTSSAVTSGVYTIQCAAPTFNPAAGSYTSATVTITTATSGASIRYTTNGTTPTSTVGTVYSSAVAISATETLQAIAYKTGLTNSAVTSGVYTMYIGTTTAGGTNTAITANEMRGTRFQAGSAITINHINLDIGTSVSGNIQCAIYSDSSSKPGTLLKGTNALNNPGTGWETFTLTSSQALTSGTYYWLLFWSAANYSVENTTASGTSWYESLTYGSWPSSAGSGTTETRTWSIYGY